MSFLEFGSKTIDFTQEVCKPVPTKFKNIISLFTFLTKKLLKTDEFVQLCWNKLEKRNRFLCFFAKELAKTNEFVQLCWNKVEKNSSVFCFFLKKKTFEIKKTD